jgi:hypothetical protein
MDTETVISGFIGSFLGVTTGFLGAVYLDWRHWGRQRRSHVLALMREMLSNNVRIRLALKEGRREGSLEDRAWQELRVALAGELPPELYNRIASRYDTLHHARRDYDSVCEGDAEGGPAESLERWADAMMEENELLRAEIDRAAGMLRALNRRARRLEHDHTAARTEAGKEGLGGP